MKFSTNNRKTINKQFPFPGDSAATHTGPEQLKNTADKDDSEVLLRENEFLEKKIRDMEFLHSYNEKMLTSIIRNNEKLIDRYMELTEKNVMEIRSSIDEFKLNLSNMNDGLQQMTRAVSDLSASTMRQNDFCGSILDNVKSVENNNELSFEDLNTLNNSIENLRNNSDTLTKLVMTVEDIADRLRYLSFNGKIQAAFLENVERKLNLEKKGEGAGFSVVASQMEKLSSGVANLVNEQTSSTTKIIENIMSSVELSKKVEVIQINNLSSLKEVTGLVSKLYDELSSVASNSEELSASAEEFSSSIEELFATIESIAENIAAFHQHLQREVELYRKASGTANELQKIAEHSESMHDAAQKMMAFFRSEFIDRETGKPSFVMARLFATVHYINMPEEYREKYFREGVKNDTIYLCLFGTTGDEEEWNDIRNSRGHQAILLPENEEDLGIMPMLARNFGKMGINYRDIVKPDSDSERQTVEDYSLEKEAEGSPFIPDQEFVKRYNIKSQLGVGGMFPSGSIFTCFLFSREPLDENFAETFRIIPMALQMALKKFDISHRFWK